MLKGFDFGKALPEQVEAFRRAAPAQRQRKGEALKRALAAHARRYLAVVDKPGGANPGQLKNAAEIIVDTSLLIQDGSVAYPVFAELVGRSRQGPVAAGVAG